jgi:hypothetical protein
MFNALMGLGWGIVGFAVIIGVGTVVLTKFAGGIASCNSTSPTFNDTAMKCQNSTGGDQYTPTNDGYTTTIDLSDQLGTSGLAGWAPAIIAFSVGMLFLGGFLIGKGGKGRKY